jgi:threonine synthase
MVERLEHADGDAMIVTEDEILTAFNKLTRSGFFVEPSSAVAYAGYLKCLKSKKVSASDKTLLVLTGTGLKTMLKPS